MQTSLTTRQEVKLAGTRAERDLQDSLAEIFSILVTIDELEKAFLKDAIPEAEYAEICERSLKQYRSILTDETVSRAFVGLEEFKAEWDVRLKLQVYLILSSGIPVITVLMMRLWSHSSRSPAQQSASESACHRRP